MTKTYLGATLLLLATLVMGGSVRSFLFQPPKQTPGTPSSTTAPAIPSPIPSTTTTPAEKACPLACSAQLTATEGRILFLQAQIDQLRDAMNNDIPILNDRTLDLNARLKHFEDQEGNGPAHKALAKALAEINELDARMVQLERPEVEDEAK